jgi:ankyrin repeat protein
MTALVSSEHPAHAGKQANLVKLLCEFGGNPNGVKDDGYPLKTAIAFRYMDAIRALVECGARVDNIVFAAVMGDLVKVKQFVADGIAPYTEAFHREMTDAKSVLEYTLCAASMAGQLAVVKYLCEQKIDINAISTSEDGAALHEAALTGKVAVARFLLEQGAHVAVQDHQNFTPLHWAAWNRHLDIVDLLLEYKTPLEAKNSYGGTVLDATVYGFTNAHYPISDPLPTLKKLVDAGADVMAVEPFPTGNSEIDTFLKPYRNVT